MKPKLKRWLCYCSGPAPPEKPVFGWQLNLCSVPSRRGATPDRDAVQAREHGGLTPAKLTRVLLTRALARGKRAGEIGFGGRPGGDGDRARAVAAGSGLCALESIWEAHLDLGRRLLASDLVHGSVWTAWRPQHQREKPHGQPLFEPILTKLGTVSERSWHILAERSPEIVPGITLVIAARRRR